MTGASHEYAYVYDNVGRLTQVTKDGAVVESYAYAGPGTGRTSETNTLRGLTNRAYANDTEDHLASAGAGRGVRAATPVVWIGMDAAGQAC